MTNHTLTLRYAVDQAHARGTAGCELILHGDGGREHLLSAFRALLVAMGYSAKTAMALRVEWPLIDPEKKAKASEHLKAMRLACGPEDGFC